MESKKKRHHLYVLIECLLCAGLLFFAYGLIFRGTAAFGLQDQNQIDGIKTAVAGTANALLGPFPTSTQPTRTASPTATATPRVSATPSKTPTRTPTKVPTRTLIGTPPERTNARDSIPYYIPPDIRQPTAAAANTISAPQPTKTESVPTQPAKTATPKPTKTPRPPQPTRTSAPPTERPTQTRAPTAEPTQSEPTATDPPAATEPPAATQPPAATDPPAATEPPAATQPPAATDPPAATEPPGATQAPITP